MLFREALAEAKLHIKLQVFASDVDAASVAFAREGQYPESIADDVSPARLARFFSRENIERFYLSGAAHGCRRRAMGLTAAPVR
jgi:chemotaxis methyl-accepting protein methylase